MDLRGRRIAYAVLGVISFGALIVSVLPGHGAYAANITARSLTLEDGASAGGSQPSGVVNHLFTFTLPTSDAIQSVKFQYCTTADIDVGGACTMPHGLSTTSATLGTMSGLTFSSLVNTTNGSPYVTSAAPLSPDGNPISVQLKSVTNPDGTDCSTVNCTFFVRISTYASADATGTAIDTGTVAAATSTQIVLTGTMPESLIFCTGATITVTNNIPDCTSATSGDIDFNQLFSPTSTTFATSQMAASTNANDGYVITVDGTTLTSGSNTIPAIGATASASTIGTGQFGMNLMANTTPAITASADVAPAPNGTNFMGKPAANFDTTNTFAFDGSSPNTVAKSDNGTGTAAPTDSQLFTSSYIVNVSGSQPAGTYVTTLTYICTPTF